MMRPRRIAQLITDHSFVVIAILLVMTGALGAGITQLDDDTSLDQFESDSPEVEASEYIDENFSVETDDEAAMITSVQLISRGDDVLTGPALVDSLQLQEALLADEAVAPYLDADNPLFGVENVIGMAAYEQVAEAAGEEPEGEPTIEEQIWAIEQLDDEQLEALIAGVLTTDSESGAAALGLMPTDYEPGSADADARMTMVTMSGTGTGGEDDMGFDEGILDSQLDIREIANDHDEDILVFGAGIIFHELDQSMADSLAIVGPFALAFVVLALVVAYRDPLDILLGLFGIIVVLIWTFGAMGWLEIPFNQMMIAVPVLLIGLSIDYAIHVFMRHREQRTAQNGADTPRSSMSIALAGVGIALVWVTATMAIGFLANLASPIGALGEFGIASAIGIVSALIIFGALVPALKIHMDGALERLGFDRQKRAFGTGGGRISSVLAGGVTAARRAPKTTILVVILLTTGGLLGATQVDTSFNEEDFLADEPPTWTSYLPGFMQPEQYGAASDLEFVNEHFEREDFQAQLLVRGDLTDPDTLAQIQTVHEDASDSDVIFQTPTGEPAVESPVSMMHELAAQDPEFASMLAELDTNDDDIPDQELAAVYDYLFEAHPEAGEVIHRTADGDYEAMQLVVSIQGDASFDDATEELRAFVTNFEEAGGGTWDVIATGDPVISHVVEGDLLNTVLQTLLLTLGAVFLFLTAAYWLTGNSVSLGLVTLTPVLVAVSWILGSMYLLDIPFNILTGMITSLTIGLGIAYSIHISSRYTLELERQGDVWDALHTTVTGTGGALLGSAATTVGAFGTLALATFPVLQQFGLVTGLTILYAFVASLFVLPVLLVVWTKYHQPEVFAASSGSDG